MHITIAEPGELEDDIDEEEEGEEEEEEEEEEDDEEGGFVVASGGPGGVGVDTDPWGRAPPPVAAVARQVGKSNSSSGSRSNEK